MLQITANGRRLQYAREYLVDYIKKILSYMMWSEDIITSYNNNCDSFERTATITMTNTTQLKRLNSSINCLSIIQS